MAALIPLKIKTYLICFHLMPLTKVKYYTTNNDTVWKLQKYTLTIFYQKLHDITAFNANYGFRVKYLKC